MKFTNIQQQAFNGIVQDRVIRDRFYFTGGTALSICYFAHRLSDDLDFFTQDNVSTNHTTPLAESIAHALHAKMRYTQIEDTHVYEFIDKDTLQLKVDFATYPYKRLEPGLLYQGISVDSILDIGANKVAAVNNRSEVKDFVDLFFILKKYSTWDLLRAYETKFGTELDLILFASNLLKVKEFDYLPKLVKKLTIPELQKYFLTLTDRIGKKITE